MRNNNIPPKEIFYYVKETKHNNKRQKHIFSNRFTVGKRSKLSTACAVILVKFMEHGFYNMRDKITV